MKQTYLLSVLCVVFTLFSWFIEPQTSLYMLGFNLSTFVNGRFWTIITSLFVHSDPTHLIGNLFFLIIFGVSLEEEIGSEKTMMIFFLGGMISSLVGAAFYSPRTYSIGASGAIFALAAAVTVIVPFKASGTLVMPLGLVALLYFFYNIIAVLYGQPGNIGYVNHLVGFFVGAIMGMYMGRRLTRNIMVAIVLFLVYAMSVVILITFT